MIYEEGRCNESLIPIFDRHGSMGKPYIDDTTVLALSCTILLMCVCGGGGKKRDERCQWIGKGVQFLIPPSLIRLNNNDLAAKHSLDKLLKLKKIFRRIRFMMKEINPSKFTIIMNKTHVVFFMVK
jgi:hypothetical protein